MLVDNVDTLFVCDELLGQPLLLRLAQSLRHRLFLTSFELLHCLNLILKLRGDRRQYCLLGLVVFGGEKLDLSLFFQEGGCGWGTCSHGFGRVS